MAPVNAVSKCICFVTWWLTWKIYSVLRPPIKDAKSGQWTLSGDPLNWATLNRMPLMSYNPIVTHQITGLVCNPTRAPTQGGRGAAGGYDTGRGGYDTGRGGYDTGRGGF